MVESDATTASDDAKGGKTLRNRRLRAVTPTKASHPSLSAQNSLASANRCGWPRPRPGDGRLSHVFGGQATNHAMLIAMLLVAITAAFGRIAYGANIPTGITLIRFLIMLAIGAATFSALALALTALIPNADAANPIVMASIYPLLFLSGIFIAFGNNTPSWILWVARMFPVRHFAVGLQAAFLGTPFRWTDVAVVAAWGVAGLLLASRYFSWEPHQ